MLRAQLAHTRPRTLISTADWGPDQALSNRRKIKFHAILTSGVAFSRGHPACAALWVNGAPGQHRRRPREEGWGPSARTQMEGSSRRGAWSPCSALSCHLTPSQSCNGTPAPPLRALSPESRRRRHLPSLVPFLAPKTSSVGGLAPPPTLVETAWRASLLHLPNALQPQVGPQRVCSLPTPILLGGLAPLPCGAAQMS